MSKTKTDKVIETEICNECKGTGRGVPNGVNVTVCPLCKGTGLSK